MDTKVPFDTNDLPFFITGPGETDVLLIAMIVFVLVVILLLGVFYLYLHALPERMAHQTNGTQLQIVSILALLALFTQQEIFWIAALIIVAIRVPDFITPISSIARSLQTMAGGAGPVVEGGAVTPPDTADLPMGEPTSTEHSRRGGPTSEKPSKTTG
jgi:hypothetical protein